MPQNKSELDIWWSALLASMAGGKPPRMAQSAALEALDIYRNAQDLVETAESCE